MSVFLTKLHFKWQMANAHMAYGIWHMHMNMDIEIETKRTQGSFAHEAMAANVGLRFHMRLLFSVAMAMAMAMAMTGLLANQGNVPKMAHSAHLPNFHLDEDIHQLNLNCSGGTLTPVLSALQTEGRNFWHPKSSLLLIYLTYLLCLAACCCTCILYDIKSKINISSGFE
jgi:hypothetical protein